MPGGRYLFVGGSGAPLLQVLTIGPVIGRAGRKRIRLLAVRLGVQHLDPLVELIRAGKITTVIDRRFTLSEVPEALRYFGEGHAKGKVVVTVGELPAWPRPDPAPDPLRRGSQSPTTPAAVCDSGTARPRRP